MLGFQAAPRLLSGQADEQFCLCSSEYEMSTCVIYCTNSSKEQHIEHIQLETKRVGNKREAHNHKKSFLVLLTSLR